MGWVVVPILQIRQLRPSEEMSISSPGHPAGEVGIHYWGSGLSLDLLGSCPWSPALESDPGVSHPAPPCCTHSICLSLYVDDIYNSNFSASVIQ